MKDTRTQAEKAAAREKAAATLRRYFPPGSYVNTLEKWKPGTKYGSMEVRVLAIGEGSGPDHTPYITEVTTTAATATGARTNKMGDIAGQQYTAQDVYEMIKKATGHDLKHNRV